MDHTIPKLKENYPDAIKYFFSKSSKNLGKFYPKLPANEHSEHIIQLKAFRDFIQKQFDESKDLKKTLKVCIVENG